MEKIALGEIQVKYLDSEIAVEGNIKDLQEPFISVLSARFECPNCGTIISVLQLEKEFREPTRCSCGRRKDFKIISKTIDMKSEALLVDKPKTSGIVSPQKLSFVGDEIVDKLLGIKENDRVIVIGVLDLLDFEKNEINPDYIINVRDIRKLS